MVTLKDVAEAAGVSKSTVSAVLCGQDGKLGIKEETSRRVRLVAARLRYRRNGIAAQMKSGRSATLVMLMRRTDATEFSLQAAVAAGSEAERRGYFLKIVLIDSAESFGLQVDHILGQCPAAVLCWGEIGACEAELLCRLCGECALPLVMLDRSYGPGVNSICTDDEDGIRQAVAHLVGLGHRRIAHYTDDFSAQFAVVRLAAFRAAMREHGLAVRDDEVVTSKATGEHEKVRAAFSRIFSAPDAPTALCCGSDCFALNAVMILQALGLRVPDRVSVTGYGNLSLAHLASPRLTTLSQPFEEMGVRAVDFALAELESGTRSGPAVLKTRLLPGESTAPPAIS